MSTNTKEKDDDISFEIVKHIGSFFTSKTGWSRELNVVSWNDGPAKLDIRDWDPDRKRCSKGITLDKKSAAKLKEWIKKFDVESLDAEEE